MSEHTLSPGHIFVGRTAELSELRDIARKAAAGEPWTIEVRGPAGVGKTQLVHRFLDGLAGYTVLRAAAGRTAHDTPYRIVHELLVPVDLATRAAFHLTDRPAPSTPPFTVGSRLIGLLGALQDDGPVALCVDDLQWADLPSVQALTCVLARLWADAVLTVLILRGEKHGEELAEPAVRLLASAEQGVRLDVTGLGAEEVRSLARFLGRGSLTHADAERLRAHTDGNALYVETVLRDLPADALGGSRPRRLPVPASLADSIHTPLAALPPASRALVDGLAVLDARVSLAQAAELAGVDDPAAALEPAIKAGLVERHPVGPASEVSLHHALYRDVVYSELTRTERAELHARAARMVDRTSAWRHLVAAADGPDDGLAAQLEQAASEELALGQYSLAGTHLLWSAELSADPDERDRRLLMATIPPGTEYVHQIRRLRSSLGTFADSPLRAYALGMAEFVNGRLDRALESWTEAVRMAEGIPEAADIAGQCQAVLSTVHIWRGEGAEAVAAGQGALATGALVPAHHLLAEAMVAEGVQMQEGARQGLARLDRLPPADQVPDAEFELLTRRADFRLLCGDLRGAVTDASTVARRALRDMTPAGGDIMAGSDLAIAHYLLGEWEESSIAANRALVALSIEDHPWDICWAHMAASLVPAGRGDWDVAGHHVATACQAARTINGPLEIVFSSMAAAVLAQAQDDPGGMLVALEPLLALPPDNGWVRGRQLWWRPLHVQALAGTGACAAARESLAGLREVADGVAYAQPVTRWLAGRIAEAEGDDDAALAHYEAGVALDTDVQPYRGMLELDYGNLLRVVGHRREASRLLHAARARFAALDAKPFLERCAAGLAACGVRRTADPGNAVSTLSEREREIVHLVGQGMTNKEIAAELFVSGKTVEYHLGGVFRKLNLRGRRELRAHLRDTEI